MNEAEKRFDYLGLYVPGEFRAEDEILEEDNKLLACRLFIDSFKVLTYEEFSAIQGLLWVASCWDSRAAAPTITDSGLFTTYNPVPLTVAKAAFVLDTNSDKLMALANRAFTKLPILKTFFDRELVQAIEENAPALKESSRAEAEKARFAEIGKAIRQGLVKLKDGSGCMYTFDYRHGK